MNRNHINLDVNPCRMCMPMGAAIAFKGIESSILLLHGSQGCSTYIRRHMATHYNEPIDIASSSLNEKQTVYGGVENLKKALRNVIRLYQPKFIGIATTCLAETIGEDIERIIKEFQIEEKITETVLVPVTTPGYGGSQYEGYYLALRRTLETLTTGGEPNGKLNIIPGNITPRDIRRIEEILDLFEIDHTVFPNFGRSLDGGYSEDYKKISSEGTEICDIRNMGGGIGTIEMGLMVSDKNSPGKYLEEEFGVPVYKCPIPIGLDNMDTFITLLKDITKKRIPVQLIEERSRMLDGMIDSHKYNGEGRAVIFGEPEIVYATSKLCIENGIFPAVIATGSKATLLKELLKEELEVFEEENIVIDDTDFHTIREYAKQKKANILIGGSDGSYITEKEGIPLVRIGFPIHDQVGGQRKLFVGYEGSMGFLDDITNTLLDEKHKKYRELLYNRYFLKNEAK